MSWKEAENSCQISPFPLGLLPMGIHGRRGTAEGSATSVLELAKYLDQRWVRVSLSPTVTLWTPCGTASLGLGCLPHASPWDVSGSYAALPSMLTPLLGLEFSSNSWVRTRRVGLRVLKCQGSWEPISVRQGSGLVGKLRLQAPSAWAVVS